MSDTPEKPLTGYAQYQVGQVATVFASGILASDVEPRMTPVEFARVAFEYAEAFVRTGIELGVFPAEDALATHPGLKQ